MSDSCSFSSEVGAEMNELHENSYDNVAATGNLEQSGNQTKKRKVQEDDDEEEKHENSHEGDVDSSPIHKKKAEVVWSMELHHKFVLAVNQLIISDAVRHGHPNILQAMPISKWCSNQFPKDIHSHGVCSTCAPKVASNYSNAICSSVNSLTPMNGAVGPECQTSTNPTFNRNQHFHFCDPGQMKHDGIMEFNVGNSLKPQQVHNINHQKSQKSCTCVANNVRSLEELVAASSSCISEELRKEIAATRDEHRKFREKLVQQDRQMQAVLQLFHTMQLQSKPT
ncbi:hypothetical protein RIF29_19043 [Crotalaria pallida]|uniref:Uncharacterized protein n=1 Tax=Crotalaria pallida TaxID=3830 RepID=A0AAN9EYU2_CROPI